MADWLREEGFLKAEEKAEILEIDPAAALSLLFKKLAPLAETYLVRHGKQKSGGQCAGI